MSETTNTAALANKVFDEIFQWLKWELCTPKDINWECCNQEKHNTKTHPSDIVFYYKDPYTGKTQYINTDLKSYKDVSINKNSMTNALKSLAMSIECATVSSEWQANYVSEDNHHIHGLLFVYNYDGSFEGNFYNKITAKVNAKNLDIPKGQFIAIFEPDTIQYLLNVCDDLKEEARKRKSTESNCYNFYYPNLFQNKTHSLDIYSATLESILSPFMIVNFADKYSHEYIVYYKESGDTIEEFSYLIDTLAVYQLLNDNDTVQVVLKAETSSNCMANFEKAKRLYAEKFGMSPNDDIFKNITTKALALKHHYYNPKNERMSNEQN